MRLFWLIISIFMIIAGLVAWARMEPVADRRGFASEPLSAVTEGTTPPAETPAAPPQRDRGFGEPIDVDDAGEPDEALVADESSPSTNMIDELSREAREQAAISEEERAELDEAQQLADELYDSAMGRQSASPDEAINGPADGPEGESLPPTSLDLQREHEHQPGQQPGQQPQNPENPWEEAAKRDEDHQPLEHSINERPDGTVVLDETFEITGQGTAAQPYEVTWDLLLSAAETYQPRLGMTDIPERIQMLDGKHVKISGHLLFPMVGVDAREVLVMLNMWDGCCLGTMPSPYDAIEVQLAEPVRANNRNFMNYGTIEGKLAIDPYLINDWLLGLYVMEDARLNLGM